MEFITFTAFVVVVASKSIRAYSSCKVAQIFIIAQTIKYRRYKNVGIWVNHLGLWSWLHLRVHLRLGFEHCQVILVRKTHFSDIQIYLQEQNTDLIFRFTKDIMPFQRGLFHSRTLEFTCPILNKWQSKINQANKYS
ncbi:unnamed protein product (macronuclear) [Paramecium tetraurelia]|uniref:Secreted protein n=1 Tax=Paramecium tetraurelia TaxID=5888 RepID=A0D6E8_PARTE|nr:uncharacterized protein GSPATT00001656001 [Paramecium tetraurelia]CAK78615.1 unnamed protein product [Paramecium tetraurelia]|eukprot:XP_001446012.1 hypothetical protein (macronuclear) [Paramecium tetraurelia strain d4-2]